MKRSHLVGCLCMGRRITGCTDATRVRAGILLPLLFLLTQLSFLTQAHATPGDFKFLWGAQQHFSDPQGIAVDATGNVYVTDTHNVQVFDSSGHRIAKWGSQGSGEGQLSSPSGIAVDGAGNVYVADTGNGRVEIFDSGGHYQRRLTDPDWITRRPIAVAVDGAGRVYVAEQGSGATPSDGTVKIFDSGGNPHGQIGTLGTGSDQFLDPGGVAVDTAGNVYVVDLSGDRVQVYTSAGAFQRTAVTGYDLGTGIALNGNGDIYVNIHQYDGEWKWKTLVTGSTGNFIRYHEYSDGPDSNGQSHSWQPAAVAVDSGGNVYTVDAFNDGIRAFDAAGNPLSQWWTYGTGPGQLSRPFGIAVDAGGNVYETDTIDQNAKIVTNRVRIFSAEGNPIREWTGSFCQTAGIALDVSGKVHVVDTSSESDGSCKPASIAKIFDSSGELVREWGDPIPTDWLHPTYQLDGIAIDKNGNFLVVHTSDSSVRIYDKDWTFLRKIEGPANSDGGLGTPAGIAAGKDGNIYVTDKWTHTITVYDSAYAFVRKWGGPGSADGLMNNPAGIAVDDYGHVYVADSGNNRVQVFETATGLFLRSWGIAGDGDAQFRKPLGIALDPSGTKVYVADTENNRIQVFEGYGPPKYDLSGTVRHANGAGPLLAGVTVSIAGQSTTTSSEGAFRIEGIIAGTYTLTISKSGYVTYSTDYTVSDNGSDLAFYLHGYSMSGTVHQGNGSGPLLQGASVEIAGKSVTTSSGGGFTIDEIPGGTYTLLIRKTGHISYSDSNYAVNGNQSGLSFFLTPTYTLSGTVRKGSASGPLVSGATVTVGEKSANTDLTGAFSLDGIVSGNYTVTVSCAGYVTNSIANYSITADRSGVVFILTPVYSVRGTVRQGSATGPVLEDATVTIAGKTAHTSSTGEYTIADIPAGPHDIAFSKTGFFTKNIPAYDVNGDKTGVDAYLIPAYTISGVVRQGSVSGAVLAGATVTIGNKSATTSSAGTFSITGIPGGSYTLTVLKAGFATKTVPGFDVNIDKNGVVFYLMPAYTVSGTVHEGSPTGPLLAGATVTIGTKTATTTSKGSFSITDIPAGTYSLTVARSGHVTKTVSGVRINANCSGLVYYLTPVYSLSGTVRQGTSTGPALAGATVTIAGKSTTTNSSGTFIITAIPAGSYAITVSKSGYISKTFTGSGYVMNTNRSGLVFYLTAQYTLSGVVRQGSATGPVVAGATVAIAGKSGTTSGTGAFSITGIPSGTYSITISKSGFVTNTITGYNLNGNKSTVLTLVPMCVLSGTVRNGSATGPVLAGATVTLAGKTATTGSTGAFSIAGIPAGTYTMTVSKSGYVTKTVTGYVLNGNKTGQVFYLTPTYTIGGTVRYGSATGPVLSGATVSIAGKSATTGSTGAFSIAGVPAGTYTVTVSKSGYITKTATGFAVNNNKSGLVFYLSR